MNNSWRWLIAAVILIGVVSVVVYPKIASSRSPQRAQLPSANPGATATNVSLPQATATPTDQPATPDPIAVPLDDVQGRVAALEAAVQKDPTDVEALKELGGLFFQLKVYPRAADAFAAAIELDPDDATIVTDLASALLYQGMLGLAKREYLRAIELDPTLPDPHFNLAVILSHSAPPDIPQALDEWREVVRLDPESDLADTSRQYIESYEALEQGSSAPATTSP